MTVRKLLNEKGAFVSVATPEATVQDIIDKLEEDDVAAIVISRDSATIEGIISGRSIVRGIKQYGRDVVDQPVGHLMTSSVITCDIDQPMKTIYELMDANQIRHIPITEQGKLCGIINTLDIVKYRLDEVNAEATYLKDYVTGRA